MHTTDGRSISEVAHLALARSQKSGNGISGNLYYILQYIAAVVTLFTAAAFICIVNPAMIIYIQQGIIINKQERYHHMKQGYIKVAAVTPDIKVADCYYNGCSIKKEIDKCISRKVKIAVFPELCITGYTCGDLFLQDTLLKAAQDTLAALVKHSEGSDILCVAGLPLSVRGRLYNTAAVFQDGRLLGLVPKTHIPNYSEFYELRHFESGKKEINYINIENLDYPVPFGTGLLFECENVKDLIVGVEICEDVWAPMPPSGEQALAGAIIIANISASDETTGKDRYRKELINNQSARLIAGYIYADAGEGESSTDLVFAGHNIIAENGICIAESQRFDNSCIISEIDIGKLISERRRIRSFNVTSPEDAGYKTVKFRYGIEDTELTRYIDAAPFVPGVKSDRDKRCNEILNIQAMGLKKRLVHTGCESAVIGISGGLDSTLALLVTAKAFDLAGLLRDNIYAVTMPCFGTTDRTYNNAVALIKCLGASFSEIDIKEAVKLHFKDIGQDENNHDVTYENSQARERTQVLMDIANLKNALVVGTGDMSELALGWATYNGDHMSMYGVNSSVPKTLVRYLVSYYAETSGDANLKEVLMDILDTPVSPELLPAVSGKISQKTEDIVGPYELHDFFLYYVMRFGFAPSKIYRLAKIAFADNYDNETIYKWLNVFYKRFFTQQFKRSCLPDGPKVGSVALSPRGDLRMPSDASCALWIKELESITL